ncbi:MAG: hypothetical protein Q7S33_02595 [Nanoarchaeota archaeon]|nr:hypothetical protein [Nanoarchaeota archaeon]
MLEDLRAKISEIGEKYSNAKTEYNQDKVYGKIQEGIEAIERIKAQASQLEAQVAEGSRVLEGTRVLLGKETSDSQERNKQSLTTLAKMYNKNCGLLERVILYVHGNKYPTLKQTLGLIEKISTQLPSYIESLSDGLNKNEKGLSSFRTDLRTNIEEYIRSRPILENDIDCLNQSLIQLQEKYEELERQRQENSSKGMETDKEVLQALDFLEIPIAEAREQLGKLRTHESNIDYNVRLTNDQIKRVGQLLNLLGESRKAVDQAENFVNVQVPYILREIGAQKAEINALSGVERTVNFLEEQAKFSGKVNVRIAQATDYLQDRVTQVQQQVVNRKSIFELEEPKRNTLEGLTSRREIYLPPVRDSINEEKNTEIRPIPQPIVSDADFEEIATLGKSKKSSRKKPESAEEVEE